MVVGVTRKWFTSIPRDGFKSSIFKLKNWENGRRMELIAARQEERSSI
jgi:hypothetical protein